MHKLALIFFFVVSSATLSAQTMADTTQVLDTLTVKAFGQTATTTGFCGCALSTAAMPYSNYSTKTSILNGLNAVSGVRMEERSPSSYRISIRGSSLRSPFGVRNIKVYWNNIPVTDPGGNTYFNQFAWNNFSDVEIFKGPASSMYGMGTGGLLLLSTLENIFKPGLSGEYIIGSYGLQNIFVTGRFGTKDNKNQVSYAHNQADGYRQHTQMRRDNFSWVSKMSRNKMELISAVLFTDMYYQTPGALTLAEFTANPKAARPAAGSLPSAQTARAAIYQKNILTGVSGVFKLAPFLKNTTTLYGSFAQIKNPAIRNYERRSEPSFGGRTTFDFNKRFEKVQVGIIAGAELQQGYFNTQVAKNKNGNPDTLQTNDDISSKALSIFAQASASINNEWFLTAGISCNQTNIAITRLNRYPVITQSRSYRNEWVPMLALTKSFTIDGSTITWSASVAKGFSPPTVAEVLPSTGVISTELEAENGWNYETAIRWYAFKNKLKLEAMAFYFKMKDALVQRRDISGADYFVNAGEANQRGIELHGDFKTPIANNIFKKLGLRSDVTLNKFTYGSFIKGTDDFTGKKLPSVPGSVVTCIADVESRPGVYLSINYYAASDIMLNDANTFTAAPYQLLGLQLGYKKTVKQLLLNLYAGADNLLNETYSLGNDINAAANRFYNAAPGRNFYIGIKVEWLKK